MFIVAALNILATTSAFAEIVIRDYPPDRIMNGKVVPSEATFSPALKNGESLLVVIEGKEAMRINVVEGQVAKVSSRFKLSKSGEITYKRLTGGNIQESANKYVQVDNGAPPEGTPSKLIKNSEYFREKIARGSYKCLALTENGFGNVLVLNEPGFRVEVIGSNIVSNNFYLGLEGSFSDKAVTTFTEAP